AFFGGLLAYGVGAIAGLLASGKPRLARALCCSFALLGGLLEIGACGLSLLGSVGTLWDISAGVPFLVYGFRLDALSTYSLGYLRSLGETKPAGLLGFFYNLLLLSLTAVFTASNAFFFLIAWEVMALASYCLISYEHRHQATRRAGILYFVMSHAGTCCLWVGFLLLTSRAGGLDFASFATVAASLTGPWQVAIFLFFFAGFGVKSG